jgi:hypothetical protein
VQRVRTTTWGWLVALTIVALSSLAGCSDVESCKETETLGCLNSAPRSDLNDPCLYDLVLRGAKCVKPGSAEDLCGLCASGALCVPERNTCVNFCEPQSPLPGSGSQPEVIYCEAIDTDNDPSTNPMLTFEDTCTRRCKLRCQRFAQFCPGYECPPGSCEQKDVQDKCLAECPLAANGGKDLACLAKSCNDSRLQICDSKLACPNGVAPACATLTCTNDCMFDGGNGLTGDGQCDDGDVVASKSAACDWGTDCIDCGPRQGTRPEAAAWGSACQYNLNCAGGSGHPSDANAWCVKQSTLVGAQRCMPDCSRGQGCPDGFSCFQVEQEDETTHALVPLIEGGITAQACLPMSCK